MDDTLINKYRPNRWEEIFGQTSAIAAIATAVAKESTRSYLLSGPSGTGKTTLARICAHNLGCAGRDILEVDAATHTGINDIRDIQDAIRYMPMEGKRRAIILDEAHRLSANAWDACLKSIEEPPNHICWFVCTTNPGKLPETVKRRCLHVKLERVAEDELTQLVEGVAQAEGLELPEGVVNVCARMADGSPGRALANLLLCQAVTSEKEAKKLCSEVIDSEPVPALCQLMLKGGSWQAAVPIIERMRGEDNESIRIQVANYMAAVLKSSASQSPQKVYRLITILDAFMQQPYRSSDGLAPIYISVAAAMWPGGPT